MSDEDIDTSDIPDFAPQPQWAKAPPNVANNLNNLEDVAVPKLKKGDIEAQLWIEATDRTSRNQAGRIRALELICELNGWKEPESDKPVENTDNMTREEIKTVKEEFDEAY